MSLPDHDTLVVVVDVVHLCGPTVNPDYSTLEKVFFEPVPGLSRKSLFVSLDMHLFQQVIPRPVTSIFLAEEEHDGHRSDQGKGHGSPYVKRVLGTHGSRPVVDKVTEPEQDGVLDRHGGDENLVGHASVGVQGVVTRADAGKHDAEQHEPVDRRGRVRGSALGHEVSKQHQAYPGESTDETRDQTVLGFVDSPVATSAPFDEGVRQGTQDDGTQDTTDERTKRQVAYTGRAEGVRRRGEELGQDEGDDDVQDHKHGVDDQDPRDRQVDDDGEWGQEELQQVLVRVGAAEQCQFLSPRLFRVRVWRVLRFRVRDPFLGVRGIAAGAGFLHVEFLLHFQSRKTFEVVVFEFVNVVSVVAVVTRLGNEEDL